MRRTDIKLDNEQGLTKSKKGNILGKIIIAIVTIPIILILIFLFNWKMDDIKIKQEVKKVENQAEQIATAKLKEKYPERNFEITDIIVTESIREAVELNKDEIIVYIKDNDNNEKYTVFLSLRWEPWIYERR